MGDGRREATGGTNSTPVQLSIHLPSALAGVLQGGTYRVSYLPCSVLVNSQLGEHLASGALSQERGVGMETRTE
jgi:hypothetical protein